MFLERLSDEEIAKIAKEYFEEYSRYDGSFIMPGSVERMGDLISITDPYMTKHNVNAKDNTTGTVDISGVKKVVKSVKETFFPKFRKVEKGSSDGSYEVRHVVYMTDFSIESNVVNPDESEFYARKMYGIFGDEWLDAFRAYEEREINIMENIRIMLLEEEIGRNNFSMSEEEGKYREIELNKIKIRFDRKRAELDERVKRLVQLLKADQEERE